MTTLSGIETSGGEHRPVLVTWAWLIAAALAVSGLHLAGIRTETPALAVLALFLAIPGSRLIFIYREPSPANVQGGVKLMLMGMVPLDAILLAGDGQWAAALGLLLLLLPNRILGRRLYIT